MAHADNWGEKLAWFFGITSPKYYWELEEFKKMSAEEEELKKKEAEENFGWTEKGEESQVKFIYSEKATKFCKIFPLLLTVCTVVKS